MHSPLIHISIMGVIGGIVLTSCDGLNFNKTAVKNKDPYVAFTNAVTAVEPLTNPELEALTSTQKTRSSLARNKNTIRLPPVTPLKLQKNVTLTTTQTLLPLNELMTQQFIEAGYGGVIDINAMNTDKAVQRFCQISGPDILTINRLMTPDERAACQANGLQPIHFDIGKDALLLVVNKNNNFIRGVSLGKLKAILTRERWSDINPSWPKQAIQRRLIGPDSADITLLANKLFGSDRTLIMRSPNTNFSDHIEPVIQAVGADMLGIGIVSYSTYQQLPQVLRAVPINGISASLETVESETYPLVQTLYLYVDRQHLKKQSVISGLINFYLKQIPEAIPEVALLPLQPSQLASSKTKWLKEMGFNKTKGLKNPKSLVQ